MFSPEKQLLSSVSFVGFKLLRVILKILRRIWVVIIIKLIRKIVNTLQKYTPNLYSFQNILAHVSCLNSCGTLVIIGKDSTHCYCRKHIVTVYFYMCALACCSVYIFKRLKSSPKPTSPEPTQSHKLTHDLGSVICGEDKSTHFKYQLSFAGDLLSIKLLNGSCRMSIIVCSSFLCSHFQRGRLPEPQGLDLIRWLHLLP